METAKVRTRTGKRRMGMVYLNPFDQYCLICLLVWLFVLCDLVWLALTCCFFLGGELENHPFHRQFMNGPVYRSGHCGSAHLLTTLLHCIIACAIHHLVIQQPFLNKLHCLHVFTQHTPQKKTTSQG